MELYEKVKQILDNIIGEVVCSVDMGKYLSIEHYCNDILDEVKKAEYVVHSDYEYDEEFGAYICGNCKHMTCSELDMEDEFEEYDPPLKIKNIKGEEHEVASAWVLKRPRYCKHCGARMDGEEKNNDKIY